MADSKKKTEEVNDIYAVQCHLDGKRKPTDKLTKHEARYFRHAAICLVNYLSEEYELPGIEISEIS